MASAKSETLTAMSRVSGGMISPKLWRMPPLRLSMIAAPIRIGRVGRSSLMRLMGSPLLTQVCVP